MFSGASEALVFLFLFRSLAFLRFPAAAGGFDERCNRSDEYPCRGEGLVYLF